MADGVGFEPTRSLHPRRFSRPVPSTARPPIHINNSNRLLVNSLRTFLEPSTFWTQLGPNSVAMAAIRSPRVLGCLP